MKILLVEDDASTRQLIANALTAHRYTVDVAGDGRAGLELALQGEYDIILLDVILPKLDGLGVCIQLRQQGCQTPILMLTAKDSDEDTIAGLDAGADDYVIKPCEPAQLIARVRALLRRQGNTITSPILSWGALCLDPTLIQVTYQQQQVALSPKEYGLLELFLRYPQRIFSRSHIIDRLWSIDDSPTDAAVTNLIKDLRRKLKAVGMTEELIETVYRLGYRLKAIPKQAAEATETNQQQGFAQINQIKQDFQASLANRIAVLESAARSLDAGNWSKLQQKRICTETHRLAGGLGTFGYAQGSDVARAIEHLFTTEFDIPSLSIQFARLLRQLKQVIVASPSVSGMPLVLVIDDRSPFTEALQQVARDRGLRVEIEPDQTIALQQIKQALPNVILLALDTRLAFLQQLTTQFPTVPVIALAAQNRMEDRIAVARLGSARYILKPAAANEVLGAIAQVLPQAAASDGKVMIVDDDADAVQILAMLLEARGLQVTPLSNPEQFWQVLSATNPDLLLLDLAMPRFSGIELCRIVRQDSNYGDLPILVVTAYTDIDSIQQVFAAGADDFISKPIVSSDLVTRVVSRVKRSRMQRQLLQFQREFQTWQHDTKIDPLTQVANRRYFDEFLAQEWQRLTNERAFLALIFCDIDYFKAYNDRYGYQAGDLCLQKVTDVIWECTRTSSDLIARLSEDTLAIILPETSLDSALLVAERIQQAIANLQLPHDASPTHRCVTLSIGITGTLPTQNNSPQDLIALGAQALYAAKARGRNTYCLYPL